MVVDLFSQPLYVSDIMVSVDEYSTIVEHQNFTIKDSNGNYHSSNNFILDKLPKLKQEIIDKLNYYRESILGSNTNLQLTQSWINYNPTGSSHHVHNHPNSIVSGVVYLTPDPAKLMVSSPLYKPFGDFLTDIKTKTKYNDTKTLIDIKQYNIVIFPSSLYHGVGVNAREETRISLSFNSFYSGILGSKDRLTYLEIN